MATQKFIAPDAKSKVVNQDGSLTPEWQRYLNGIQALEKLLLYYVGSGTGSPQGVIVAPVGSFYTRTDGGAGTSFYIKEADPGLNTGWVGK